MGKPGAHPQWRPPGQRPSQWIAIGPSAHPQWWSLKKLISEVMFPDTSKIWSCIASDTNTQDQMAHWQNKNREQSEGKPVNKTHM
jgi:hypothetical protein